jgi:uncharacterized lipoprotein YajG
MFKSLCILAIAASLAACSTTRVDLRYEGSSALPKTASVQPIVVTAFKDARKDDPNWMGAIRGGFGNALKTLESNQPVAVVVQTAFADGLRARGVTLVSNAKLSLSGTIQKFESITVIRRAATIVIDLKVTDLASGQDLLSKTFEGEVIDSSSAGGVFASIDNLRATTENALRQIVDRALDDTEVRQALKI